MPRRFFDVVKDVHRALKAAGAGGLTAAGAAQAAGVTDTAAIQALGELWIRNQAIPEPVSDGKPAVWRVRAHIKRVDVGEVPS